MRDCPLPPRRWGGASCSFPGDDVTDRFLPFPIPQVCDDEWHHYALNLEFPTVTLYADGISFDPALIHDNGLIHPPRREPALMIGACWTGKSRQWLGPPVADGGAKGQPDLMSSSPCSWAGRPGKISWGGDHSPSGVLPVGLVITSDLEEFPAQATPASFFL